MMDPHTEPVYGEQTGGSGLLHRLEQLERENRRLRRYGTMMLMGIAVILGLGAALIFFSGRFGLPGSAQVVVARQFEVRDIDGRVRGVWGAAEDGSVRLAFNDVGGRQRVRVSLLADGSAGLSFADSADRKLAVLGLLPDNTTTLALTDPAGIPRVVLGVAPNGSSNLVFADRLGTTRAGLGVDVRGLGTFTLAERDGVGGAREELLDTLEASRADSGLALPPEASARPNR
ncbi:MAG: hypothetical protein H0T68_09280 [Gemmatimonadales bacterium]|nr:hypothetical protein [Gemmatimonadales bacterium]